MARRPDDKPARPYKLQTIPPRRDPVTGRRARRYHKACKLNGGRRVPRTRRQIEVWRKAVMLHYRRGELTDARLLVILAVPDWLNRENGRCDPSHDTIADRVGVTVRTVQRALADATRLRLIDWDQRAIRFPGETVQITNQYRIFPGLAAATDAPAIEAPPCREQSDNKKEGFLTKSGCSDSTNSLEKALAALAATGGWVFRPRTA